MSSALKARALWAAALGAFAIVHSYPLALVFLFLAGFFELSFSSMNADDRPAERALGDPRARARPVQHVLGGLRRLQRYHLASSQPTTVHILACLAAGASWPSGWPYSRASRPKRPAKRASTASLTAATNVVTLCARATLGSATITASAGWREIVAAEVMLNRPSTRPRISEGAVQLDDRLRHTAEGELEEARQEQKHERERNKSARSRTRRARAAHSAASFSAEDICVRMNARPLSSSRPPNSAPAASAPRSAV